MTETKYGSIWNRAGWLALSEEAHRAGDRFSIILVELPDAHELNVATEVVQARHGGEQVGRYTDRQLVILLRESTDTGAQYLGYRLGRALRVAGLDAGIGCADSDTGAVDSMLVAAAGEAIVCRTATIS
jgi:hypothetical protein